VPADYEDECNRLTKNAKLFFNGSCYVGSNTETQFGHAITMCNDIPSAAISRLAWIESEELLEKLREVFVIRGREGRQVGYCHLQNHLALLLTFRSLVN
jgi:hypothetical protein